MKTLAKVFCRNHFLGGKKKMARKSLLFFAALISVIFVACATQKTLVTEDIRYDLKDADDTKDEKLMRKVQYYIDEEILLSREMRKEEPIQVSYGTVRYESGRRIIEVLISKETRGELIYIQEFELDGYMVECLGVCFEKSDADLDKILWFRPGKYKNFKDEGYYLVNLDAPDGKYRYGNGKEDIYDLKITGGGSRWPYLLGVIKEKRKLESNRRKAQGRIVR